MHEDIEQRFGQLVASLSPEQYERLGLGLREDRLALAERGEALREFERVREGTRGLRAGERGPGACTGADA